MARLKTTTERQLKPVVGQAVLAELEKAGVIPPNTTEVVVRLRYGAAVSMDVTTLVDAPAVQGIVESIKAAYLQDNFRETPK